MTKKTHITREIVKYFKTHDIEVNEKNFNEVKRHVKLNLYAKRMRNKKLHQKIG